MEQSASIPCHCTVCGLDPRARTVQRTSQHLIAESPAMQTMLRRAARFAATDAPIVILGESGTGKDLVARVLHANSPRKDKPFVAVNVAALPAELLESELFGHAKGSFTGAATAKKGLFEAAHGGTLFLDEIGEMPIALQAKLLRALQDGEVRRVGETRSFAVDARIICATHRDLTARVAQGHFREDLYYRLKVLSLTVPPLRERPEDIEALARNFLAAEGTSGARFSPAASRAMRSYPWPGNVRELASAVKHGVALADRGVIELDHLPEELLAPESPIGSRPRTTRGAATSGSTSQPGSDTRAIRRAAEPDRSPGSPALGGSGPAPLRSLAEVEREYVLEVLARCGGSQTEAARILGIGRNTLWRKLRLYEDSDGQGNPDLPID